MHERINNLIDAARGALELFVLQGLDVYPQYARLLYAVGDVIEATTPTIEVKHDDPDEADRFFFVGES